MTEKAPSAFRTISEAAEVLDVPQHVLRFWETRFSQVRPMKRAGGRRYYRPEDIELLRRIRSLLYDEGYTIKGVQKVLRQAGRKSATSDVERTGDAVTASSDRSAVDLPATAAELLSIPAAEAISPGTDLSPEDREELEDLVEDLRDLATILKARSRL